MRQNHDPWFSSSESGDQLPKKSTLWDAALSRTDDKAVEMWNAAAGAPAALVGGEAPRISCRIASVRDGMTCCIRRRTQAPASPSSRYASNLGVKVNAPSLFG